MKQYVDLSNLVGLSLKEPYSFFKKRSLQVITKYGKRFF
jgi:hypothetical protein